jgi:hypothetical protein
MRIRYAIDNQTCRLSDTLVPALVMVILLMFMVFPDSFRLLAMRPH